MLINQKNDSGLVALMTVVIVGAAALTLALSAALSGVRELELATTIDRGVLAKTFVDGCLDRALLALRFNPSPTSYEFTDVVGQCTITISDEGGGNRRLVINGEVGENRQSLTVLVTPAPISRSVTITNYSL